MKIVDAYINDYAEFRNKTLTAIVDNAPSTLYPCDIQLHTAKKGSLGVELNNSAVINTSGDVVNYDSDKIANKLLYNYLKKASSDL